MKRTALIIDDNRLIANSLMQMLDMLGYEAQAAYGSLVGIQTLGQMVPDLILLDLHMQGVNGVEVCRYIRRDPRLAKVPVLAISSDNQEMMIASVREAGANAFLAKPIEFDALEKVVKYLESRRGPASEATELLTDKPNVSAQTRPHQS